MTTDQIKAMQKRIGVTPDGIWGTLSERACRRYLRSLMPSPNPWPETDQPSLMKFYGKAGDESRLTQITVDHLGMEYGRAAVARITCHESIAASLLRILTALASSHPHVLQNYDGCYNNRLMRGGSLPSLHARGAAVDFLSEDNGNQTRWPDRASMPLEVMECFAREGWLSGGAFWGRDAMHFQATR